jgi:hypothetical protein
MCDHVAPGGGGRGLFLDHNAYVTLCGPKPSRGRANEWGSPLFNLPSVEIMACCRCQHLLYGTFRIYALIICGWLPHLVQHVCRGRDATRWL